MFLQYGESIQNLFPWGIPWWDPAHLVFFGVFYLALSTIGIGLGLICYKTYKDMKKDTRI